MQGLFTADGVAEVILFTKVLGPDGKELFSEEILGREVEWPVFLMGGANAKATLEKALATAISKTVTNGNFLSTLLDNKQIIPMNPS